MIQRLDGLALPRMQWLQFARILRRCVLVVACAAVIAESRTGRAQVLQASPDGMWKPVAAAKAETARAALIAARPKRFRPTNFQVFTLAPQILQAKVQQARADVGANRLDEADESTISLPLPDGTFQRFLIAESSAMSPALAAKFPEIKSYRGQGIDDPAATLRLDLSGGRLRAQIMGPGGTTIIDPTSRENEYVTFDKASNRALSAPFRCLVRSRPAAARGANAVARSSGQFLRTYRLAVACTGEYAQSAGGTAGAAMAAINTTVNRVNGIFERELAVRLLLVDDNDELIFTNPQTDPFTNNDAEELIDESQVTIDARIGNANYDIGHTFSTGAGGLAGLGVVCQTGEKARGVTGRDDPFGDPFDVDFVAHEIGHQFGGDHTFNGRLGSCAGGNRNGPTAMEPGSGSTIQAYAGICNSDDLQPNSDAYFHAISLEQIVEYTTVGPGNAPPATPTGNNPPTVDAGPDFTIPARTPFMLTANGVDPDGDPLLYCWEQLDLGGAANIGAADDGKIPLFRSFRPRAEPSRAFPQMADVLGQLETPGEKIPAKARDMRFRVTARDGRSEGGGVNSDDAVVKVVAGAGPFQVTAPAVTTVPSPLVEVAWKTAGTADPPINCKFVNILLSTDGGQTFSTTLASNTPNDGKELVALPSGASNLRLMVRGANNVFFAVSPKNFAVQSNRATIFVVRHAEKQAGDDPDLTEVGQRRARTLARLASPSRPNRVYATDTRRTVQTAQPTAEASGVEVTTYSDPANLADELRALDQGEHILVVGHSNTVDPILSGLGATSSVSIGEEFNNLFVVALGSDTPIVQRFKYEPDEVAAVEALAATMKSDRGRRDAGKERASSAATAAAPAHRFAMSDGPVTYLEQNWSSDEALEFYSLRQGSPVMRMDFFRALEQPDGAGLFGSSEYLASFGFLPQFPHARNRYGFPVGFVGEQALELSCAACHTSEIKHSGQAYRIDGTQAMTDVDRWMEELVDALGATLDSAPSIESLEGMDPGQRFDLDEATKFGRFAARVLGIQRPRVSQVYALVKLLQQDHARRQRYNDYNRYGRTFKSEAERSAATKRDPYGYGRLDALGAILNQACAEALTNDANAAAANAPVNYPAIWDAPQHTHVQWNGAVDNTAIFGPLGRNSGQVIGVFGLIDVDGDTILGYDSSIRFESLERAEKLITKLWSPVWPSVFGRNEALAGQGKAVYQRQCVGCHAPMQRDDPDRRAMDVLVSITKPHGLYPPLATDDLTARNWSERRARLGPLAGRYVSKPLGERFADNPNAEVPSRDVLGHLVFGAIARSFVPWREELTLDSDPQRSMTFAKATAAVNLMRYKSRPLNGVWSTAPYLHNGSVLNMVELLKRPEDRLVAFRVGSTEYDPDNMGYRNDGPFEFDVAKPGNGNGGHAYGVDLAAEEKTALIEYLKTL